MRPRWRNTQRRTVLCGSRKQVHPDCTSGSRRAVPRGKQGLREHDGTSACGVWGREKALGVPYFRIRLAARFLTGCSGLGLGHNPEKVKVASLFVRWLFVTLLCAACLSKMSSLGHTSVGGLLVNFLPNHLKHSDCQTNFFFFLNLLF